MSKDLPQPIVDLNVSSDHEEQQNVLSSKQSSTSNDESRSSKNKPTELLVWDAPNRQFDQKSPQWYLGLFALGLIGITVFALLREVWLILVTAAIIFVYYAMARVEPADIEHRVFTTGIDVGGKFYSWKDDLKSFWIQRGKQSAELQLETNLFFPHTLELLLPPDTSEEDLDELQELVETYLPIQERTPSETGSMVDHAILSISNKLPYKQKLAGWFERRMS